MAQFDMSGQQIQGNQNNAGRDQYNAGGDIFIQVPAEPGINLEEAEATYRQQVITVYNRLNFGGFESGDVALADASLEDIFVHLTLTVEHRDRGPVPTEEVSRSMRHADSQREPGAAVQQPLEVGHALSTNLLIVGEPGAGKSTLLRWLAVTFAEGRQRNVDRLGPSADTDRLPVLVELGRLPTRYLNPEGGEVPSWLYLLPQYITEQEAFFGTPAQVLKQALVDGRGLLLFDGLDEVADRQVRARLARSLAELARLSPNNRIIIGSRSAGVSESENAMQHAFRRCQIARFTLDDVQRFFRFCYALDRTLSPEQQRANAEILYARIQAAPKTLELATTPLLSTIFLLIWRNENELPERRAELYERCSRVLIEQWEHHHDIAYQGIFARLGWERHLRLLAPLAYAIHSREQQTSAGREELLPVLVKSLQVEGLCSDGASATMEAEQFLMTLGLRSGLLQHMGGDRYGFPHLTFQEYLAARFIASQRSPAYIDLVLAHLHEPWWQEVHLLTIGHLGSGGEQTPEAVNLLQKILGLYRRPWLIWFFTGSFPQVQLNRRIAWTLGREFELAVKAVAECAPDGRLQGVNVLLAEQAAFLARRILDDVTRVRTQQRLLAAIARVPMGARVLVDYLREHYTRFFSFRTDRWAKILNQLAEVELAQSEKEKVIELVLLALQDPEYQTSTKLRDRQIWVDAARYLGRFGVGSQKVVDALLIALQDPAYEVREQAAKSLGLLGISNEAVIKALLQLIYHEETRAVRAAARSLAQLAATDKAVLQVIQQVAHDPNGRARGHIAWSLGWLGADHEFVVPTLLQLAHDPDWMVRSPAIESLTWLRIEDKTIMQILFQALHDENDSVCAGAIEGLERLAPYNKNVVPALQQMLYWDDLTRPAASTSLERIAKSNPTAIDAFLQVLNDPKCPDRFSIVWSLGKVGVGNSAVVNALLQTLQTLDNDSVRYQAVQVLGALGIPSEAVVKALLQALDDPDVKMRQAAAESLGKLGRSDKQIIDALLGKLLDQNWYGPLEQQLHIDLAKSLGTLGAGNKRVIHVFQRVLYEEVSDAMKAALKVDKNSEEYWESYDIDIYQLHEHHEEQLEVQYAIAESLGRLTSSCEEAMKATQQALQHKDSKVRLAVMKGLGQGYIGHPMVVKALLRSLRGDAKSGVAKILEGLGEQLRIRDEILEPFRETRVFTR